MPVTGNNKKGDLSEGFSFKRVFFIGILVVLVLTIIVVLGTYFFIALNQASRLDLLEDVCLYENSYLTCGKQYTLVYNGYEYNLTANKPFKFPEGSNNLIGLTDYRTSYVFLLSPGEHNLKDTSTVNSSVVI